MAFPGREKFLHKQYSHWEVYGEHSHLPPGPQSSHLGVQQVVGGRVCAPVRTGREDLTGSSKASGARTPEFKESELF